MAVNGSESPARRQLNHIGVRQKETMTDKSLKQKSSGSFKNIIEAGFSCREERVREKKNVEEKREQCFLLKKMCVGVMCQGGGLAHLLILTCTFLTQLLQFQPPESSASSFKAGP